MSKQDESLVFPVYSQRWLQANQIERRYDLWQRHSVDYLFQS